tara:strand:- start:81 stop:815 length:735 start_codon:yes stop_codon:yes gene_type:complete
MRFNKFKKISHSYPALSIENFLSPTQCKKIINQINTKKKFDIVSIHNRKMLIKGYPEFKKLLNKSKDLFRLLRYLNNKKTFNYILNLFQKNKNFIDHKHEIKFFDKNHFTKHNIIKGRKFIKNKRKTLYLDLDISVGGNNYHRGPHRDKPNRVIVFLIYLNTTPPNNGGELELLNLKRKSYIHKKNLNYKHFQIKKIKPKAGKMIIFYSNKYSFHSVAKYIEKKGKKRFFMYGSFSLKNERIWS